MWQSTAYILGQLLSYHQNALVSGMSYITIARA